MIVIQYDLSSKRDETEVTLYTLQANRFELHKSQLLYFDPITGKNKPLSRRCISTQLTADQATRELESLIEKHPEVDFDLVESEYHHIIASGTRKELNQLPFMFKKRKSETNKLSDKLQVGLDALPPFSKINKTENGFEVNGQLSLEEFMELPTYAWDSEARNWEKEFRVKMLNLPREVLVQKAIEFDLVELNTIDQLSNKQINDIIIKHMNELLQSGKLSEEPMSYQFSTIKDGKPVVHYLEHLCGQTETTQIKIGSELIECHKYKSANYIELMGDLMKIMSESDMAIMIGQNSMNYDTNKTLEFTRRVISRAKQKGEKSPIEEFNVRGASFKIRRMNDFISTAINGAFYHIDTKGYSQNYFPFTIDNKFETIISLILDEAVKKTEGYDDLTRMSIEMLFGSEQAADLSRIYGCGDVVYLNKIQDYMKKMVYLKSCLFKRNPEEVCITSRRNLAQVIDEHYFMKHDLRGRNWKAGFVQEYDKIESIKEFTNGLTKEQKKAIRKAPKHGLHRATIYMMHPFTTMYFSRLKEREEFTQVLQHIKESECNLEKFDLINTIENGYLLPLIFFDSKQKFKNLEMEKWRSRFATLVNEFQPLNHSGSLFVWDEKLKESEEFQRLIKGLGTEFVSGDLISFARRSFVLYDGLNFYKREIDFKGTGGYKTIAQKELIYEMEHMAFQQGTQQALIHYSNFLESIKNGTVEREKLIYFKEQSLRNYCDYSTFAMRQRRTMDLVKQGIVQGERIAYGKVKGEIVPVEEFLKIPDHEFFSKENVDYLMSQYLGYKRKVKDKKTMTEKEEYYYKDCVLSRYFLAMMPTLDFQKGIQLLEQGRVEDLFTL